MPNKLQITKSQITAAGKVADDSALKFVICLLELI
jgi:hypothetical protein